MFRLDKHIEVLLMKHDCVVLPRFGGFVKHHIDARIDKSNGLLMPPMEVVGFNPQLTLNDSLLVQSYVEAYDYSYPEALSIVEKEIDELRAELYEQGSFELGAVGELTANKNGTIIFEPLPSGAIIPQLYGLSSIDLLSSDSFSVGEDSSAVPNIININTAKQENNDFVIRISRRTLRRLAAACVALMLIASIPFIGKNVNTKELVSGINLDFLTSLMPSKEDVSEQEAVVITEQAVEEESDVEEAAPVESEESVEGVESDEGVESAEVVENVEDAEHKPYTIVVASMIPKKNAELFTNQLLEKNNISATIMPEGSAYRVVVGEYTTAEEAQQARRSLITIDALADAWVARTADL